jgi:hypothetical protein
MYRDHTVSGVISFCGTYQCAIVARFTHKFPSGDYNIERLSDIFLSQKQVLFSALRRIRLGGRRHLAAILFTKIN